jgi:hypothetical protein
MITMLRSPLGTGASLCAALATLLLLSPPCARPARADEPAPPGNANLNLKNVVESSVINGTIPLSGGLKLNVLLLPGDDRRWATADRLPSSRFRHAETLRASGKVLIAGGMGKRGLTFSAEMYDLATDTWLAKSQISTGRGQSSTALPNNGRILVWWGVIVPF